MGTTGESVTLEEDEKKELLSFVISNTNKKVPVVLGLGGNNTSEIIKSFSKFDLENVDGILSVSPYYNKPTQWGIYEHYKAVADASPLPIILYNVPGRTGSNMAPETTLRIAEACPNVIGIKEAAGNIEQVMRIIKHKPENFMLISGDDNLTLPMIASGAVGVISVVANAFPSEFSKMVKAAMMNDMDTARSLHYSLFEITEQLFADGNPGGIKAALKLLGICDDNLRLPLVKAKQGVYTELGRLIEIINSQGVKV
jgi:4-hydroxy-tetrahydrodipicolinate synthase